MIKRDSKKARVAPVEAETPEPKRQRKGVDLLRRYTVSSSSADLNENTELRGA